MEIKEIKELALLMKEMGLSSLEYRGGGSSVKMQCASTGATTMQAPMAPTAAHQQAHVEEAPAAGGFVVKSPMVGVFYAAPGSDKPPYVSVGDTVHAGDILCIIEAMKIMNEITAERDGIIAEVCAENKQIVEYGQPLFRIDTN